MRGDTIPSRPGGPAGGALSGSYPSPGIAAGAVGSAQIADGSIADVDVSATAAIAPTKIARTAVPVRIMALGDSTTGNAASSSWSATGWLTEAQRLLRAQRDDIDWIGSLFVSVLNPYYAADPYQDGHSGYKIEELATGRVATDTGYAGYVAAAGQPDIVVVSAGTNNFATDDGATCAAKFGALLDVIKATSPNARVLAWSPPPSPTAAPNNVNRNAFVALLAATVAARGPNFYYVDAGSILTLADKQQADVPAFTHPNRIGYARIARTIVDFLTQYILPPPTGLTWPRSKRLRPAQSAVQFTGAAADKIIVPAAVTGLNPGNAQNFAVGFTAYLTAFAASQAAFAGYGNDYTEGYLVTQSGASGTCNVYMGAGAPKMASVPGSFKLNTFHRVLLAYDAASQILSLWIDGVFRYRVTGIAPTFVANRATTLGTFSGVNAITGLLERFFVCSGAAVPGFKQLRRYAEADYAESVIPPGCQEYFPCDDGSGTVIRSAMHANTSNAFGGATSWSAAGAVATPWDE
jgi:lysophospholipase L1-like esterase